VVREGDTLWRIAKAYGIEQEEILKANRLTDIKVEVGQKLLMPGATEQVDVARYRPPKPGEKFRRKEAFGYPCVGRIIVGFGQWKGGQKTEGIDFAVSPGAKVVASRTGEAVLVARAFPGYGIVVILQHGPSYRTFYGYLAETPVRVGDAVAKGEVIGVTGTPPRGGKHGLHFKIYEGRDSVSPLKFLR
jgi:murein DD-endopeptidase MepM/ murein hydrolase activator NlpD